MANQMVTLFFIPFLKISSYASPLWVETHGFLLVAHQETELTVCGLRLKLESAALHAGYNFSVPVQKLTEIDRTFSKSPGLS